MSDLESELLTAALDFGRARLEALLDSVATDAKAILLSLVPAATAAQIAAVEAIAPDVATDLADAQTNLSTFGADLTSAHTLADLESAFGQLASALTAVDDAATKVSTAAGIPVTNPLGTLVKSAVKAGGDAFGGLIDQLGLGGAGGLSDNFTSSGTVISYQLANLAARDIPPAPAGMLTLSNTTFTAALDCAEPKLTLTLTTGLAINLAADGFVQEIVGSSANVDTTLTVTVDTSNGLRFQAGAKGRANLDGSLAIPGVNLHELGIEIPDGDALGLALTGTLEGSLGPIDAIIQGAGVALTFDPSKFGTGNPVSLALQPPTGAGLTVDAGVVHGGGFVVNQGTTYGGALDLALGPIEIKAVGLVGTDPFSLVLVLSVRFTPAIQLSFGFTLNAVGGLLALERTISTDALRAGIHDHTADTVLFPADPVGSAPTILQLLQAIFPPQQGAFVAGPMLELGWGAPISFVTARLGVIIALPDPKVILIGSLRVALPDPDVPIVDLRADIYGEITPDHLLVLVSLGGSKIAGFSLAGDFGVLIAWGDDPDLAISAGGFHPHYSPPGELAGMRRVSVDLSPPSLLTLRAEAYIALTSNSFQLGTRVELKAEVAGVGAEGHLEFDALVLWEPTFHFEIDLSAGISLYAFGESFASVTLSLHLEGPGPWAVQGSASLSLLFFDIDLNIPRIVWGSGSNDPAPAVHPQDLVFARLQDKASWVAQLPDGASMLARLVPLADEAGVVHPLGALEARQHVLPLETVIDHIGASPVDVNRINLGQPVIGDGAVLAQAISNATDTFAPGDFLVLTDDEKLSRPAFEPFPAGAVVAAATSIYGAASTTNYEWFTVMPPGRGGVRQTYTSLAGLHELLLRAGPAGAATPAAANPYAVIPDKISLADPGVARVRSTVDLSVPAGVSADPMTTTAAARVVAGLTPGTAQWVGAGVGA
jgi:hypothetical protein